MGTLFGLWPFLLKLYADSGYQGETFQTELRRGCHQIIVEIAKRANQHTFVVLPKRWIVKRSIAWLNRSRRLAKDWECLSPRALALLRWASIRRML
jgi:transposase